MENRIGFAGSLGQVRMEMGGMEWERHRGREYRDRQLELGTLRG